MGAADWQGLNNLATLAGFSNRVAEGTGLDARVIWAWVLAEGGPHDNPLNIGPGRHYGSTKDAADATIRLLKTPTYSGIRRAASGSAEDQIRAIAASAWVGPSDPMKGKPYENLLRGTLQRVPSGSGPLAGVDVEPGDVVDAVTSPVTEAVGDALGFVQDKALSALAHVALAGAAFALFVLGVQGVTGLRVTQLVGAGRGRSAARGEIPF